MAEVDNLTTAARDLNLWEEAFKRNKALPSTPATKAEERWMTAQQKLLQDQEIDLLGGADQHWDLAIARCDKRQNTGKINKCQKYCAGLNKRSNPTVTYREQNPIPEELLLTRLRTKIAELANFSVPENEIECLEGGVRDPAYETVISGRTWRYPKSSKGEFASNGAVHGDHEGIWNQALAGLFKPRQEEP